MVGLSLYPQPMARLTVFYCPWGNPNSDQEGSQGPPSVRYSRTLPIRRSSRRLPWKISGRFPWTAVPPLFCDKLLLTSRKEGSVTSRSRHQSSKSVKSTKFYRFDGIIKLMVTIVTVTRWHSWQENPYFQILQEGGLPVKFVCWAVGYYEGKDTNWAFRRVWKMCIHIISSWHVSRGLYLTLQWLVRERKVTFLCR